MIKLFFMRTLTTCIVLFFLVAAGCRKVDAPVTDPPLTKVHAAPLGLPFGTPVVQTIGSSGGTLQTADGALTITIPAGAVETNTLFSIQPVKNTAPNGLSTSYQLLPEGTHFKQPVSIRFHYSDDDMDGGSAEALRVSWQDTAGIWHLAQRATVDTGAKTVTVASPHFSRWAMNFECKLIVDKPSIDLNEVSMLSVRKIRTYDLGTGDTEMDTTYSQTVVKQWSLDGQGSLKPQTFSSEYHSPPVQPAVNPVSITATVDPHEFNSTLLKLQRKVYVSKSFLELEFEDNTNIYPDAKIVVVGGMMEINAHNSRGNGVDFNFLSNGGEGSYPWGSTMTLASKDIQLLVGGMPFTDMFFTCEKEEMKTVHGTLTISKWAAVKDYVEGTFSGTVVPAGACDPPYIAISGRFKARRL